MLVKFIRNTVAGGNPVRVDDVLELPDTEAQFLIYLGKAVLHVEDVAEEVAADPESIEDTQLETEKPKKKKGK